MNEGITTYDLTASLNSSGQPVTAQVSNVTNINATNTIVGAPGQPGPPGANGANGQDGVNGVGVPMGGATGTALFKTSSADYATTFRAIAESDVTNLSTDLAVKAPLASPALTGVPTAPTASPLTNNTQLATTAYTDTAVGVESTRAQAAESSKLPLAGGTMTGPIIGLEDKGGQVFNVKAYGATGNGSTSDSSAVQSAATAALLAGGKLYFPPGVYVVYNITFGNNLIVEGAGIGNTILLMDPTAPSGAVVCRVAPASNVTTTSNCHIRDLTIDGNKSIWGANSTQKGYGYYCGQSTKNLISNCSMFNVEIRNCMTYAFDIENATNIQLTNCVAHDNGYSSGTGTHINADGFTLIGDDITVTACQSYNNAVRGYLCGQSANIWHRVELIGCEAWGNASYGVDLGSDASGVLYNSHVIGGRFYSNGAAGIYLTVNSANCSVVGASTYNNATNGIQLNNANHCAIQGNTCYNNATASSSNPEIYLTNTTTYCTITGNVVNSTTATHAISEQNSSTDYNAITGNNVTSTSTTIVVNGTHTQTANNVPFDTKRAAAGANSDITSLSGLTTPLPISEGGTGSATQNFVDLTTNQSIAGIKTFSGEVVIPTQSNPTDAAQKQYVDAETTRATTAESLMLQKANNLSDVANITTARSNINASQWFVPTAVKTGPYTASPADYIPVDTTSGAVTITLPTAPADKTRIGVKMVIQGSTNTVTVATGGTDVFNKAGGATSLTLTLLAQGVLLQYASATGIWYIQADDLPLSQLDARYTGIAATVGGDLTGTLPNPQIAYSSKTVTTAYTQVVTDTLLLCDATSGNFIITAPDATTMRPGKPYRFKRIDVATKNYVTILPFGSSYNGSGQLVPGTQTIDGAFYYMLANIGESITLISDGANLEVY